MEHKKRKMFAAIAVLMLCAVAIIGVGYAYTASTENASNSATSEYISIYQGGDGAYTFTGANNNVYWNSIDSKTGVSEYTTKYKLDGGAPISIPTESETTVSYFLKQVGQDFLVKATQTGGNSRAPLTCSIDATNFVYDSTLGTCVFLKVTPAGESSVYMLLGSDGEFHTYNTTSHLWDGAATFSIPLNSGLVYKDTTVQVYYGYAGNADSYVSATHAVNVAPEGPTSTPITNASLLFSVVVNTTPAP